MSASAVRLLLCLLILNPSLLAAQDTVVAPGTRVRINGEQIGQLVTWDEQQLVLSNATFSEFEVEKLEVSLGTSKTAKPWAIGLGVGASIGFASGFVLCAGDRCDDGAEWTAAGVLGLTGAALGAIVGLAVGSSSTAEKWREVPLSRLQVGIVHGGPVFLVALRL